MTPAEAIAESIAHGIIITLRPHAADFAGVCAELSALSDDRVATPDVHEFWGEAGEVMTWRVHVAVPPRPDDAAEVTS